MTNQSQEPNQDGCRVENLAEDWKAPAPFNLQRFAAFPDIYYPSQQDPQGLIPQNGLKTGSLPLVQSEIEVPKIRDVGHDAARYLDLHGDVMDDDVQFLSPRSTRHRDFGFYLGTPELENDLTSDLREYTREIQDGLSCDLSRQWLPLSPVVEKDGEGLEVPPQCSRIRALLLRELDREQIRVSEQALVLWEEARSADWDEGGGVSGSEEWEPEISPKKDPLSSFISREVPFISDEDEGVTNPNPAQPRVHKNEARIAPCHPGKQRERSALSEDVSHADPPLCLDIPKASEPYVAETPSVASTESCPEAPELARSLFPSSKDSHATTNLLSRFMEMRPAKKPRTRFKPPRDAL